MFAATRCLPKFRNRRFPFACNALKIWELRNFPLDFLGQERNTPRAEKTLYRIPPPPGTSCYGMLCDALLFYVMLWMLSYAMLMLCSAM